jgi:arginase family enzyme
MHAKRPPAQTRLISLYARVSENTPRDLCGVETLTSYAAATLKVEPNIVEGRRLPFGRTPWEDDLQASRRVLTVTADHLADALLVASTPPLTLATDCALALATLPVVERLHPEARVLWLDAHCDFDTPETTTIGFLGCMSLAGACGLWDTGFRPSFPPGRVVLCGTRPAPNDFDIEAQRCVEQSAVTLVGISAAAINDVLTALEGAPVYVHLDPDVLDPTVNPLPYARPGGLTAETLGNLLAAVATQHAIVGVEIAAFHAPEAPEDREKLAALLFNAVMPLLAEK